MNLDDEVCLCFHVSRRKLVNWAARNRPTVPSQMALCGGAGTGCGWCVPFLKQIFRQSSQPELDPQPADIDQLSAEEYAARRTEHIQAGKGTPPAGAVADSPPGG
ncbi:MAG: (2Fe-2S)-binding protein [Gemmataceae bacterium]|nr:(2Fe-2S)-binding protein [Gemmataceae bacterium]